MAVSGTWPSPELWGQIRGFGVFMTVVTEELDSWTLSQCHCLHSETEPVPCVFMMASWSSEQQAGRIAVAVGNEVGLGTCFICRQ